MAGIVGPVRKVTTPPNPATKPFTPTKTSSQFSPIAQTIAKNKAAATPIKSAATPIKSAAAPAVISKFTVPTWAKWVGGVLAGLLTGFGIYKVAKHGKG